MYSEITRMVNKMYRKDVKNNSDVPYIYIQECYNSSSTKGMSAQICTYLLTNIIMPKL